MARIFMLTLLVLVCSVSCDPSPPIFNQSYRISFDETYVQNTSEYKVNGQHFYDPLKNRERVDRVNGRYNYFCGSVLPNVTTACQIYTKNSKRYIVHPQKSMCCFCCDSDHGCGILKPDWIADGVYKGRQKIVDTQFDKWSKDGMFGYNYLWTTTDEKHIPRKLDQGGSHIIDYIPHTFQPQTFPDSVFALPNYCNETTPANCPLTSACGQLRS